MLPKFNLYKQQKYIALCNYVAKGICLIVYRVELFFELKVLYRESVLNATEKWCEFRYDL